MDYLTMLKSQLNGISSNWNGDDNGEERALIADDGLRLIEELEDILKYLKIY